MKMAEMNVLDASFWHSDFELRMSSRRTAMTKEWYNTKHHIAIARLQLLLLIGRVHWPLILTVFRGFSQSIQANAGITIL